MGSKSGRLVCAALAAVLLGATGCGAVTAPAAEHATRAAAATGTRLAEDNGKFPAAVRLRHSGEADGTVLAATVSFGPEGSAPIYRSTDGGATFTEIHRITDPSFTTGLCCGSLLEMPQQVGDLPAGTLLWSASVGANGPDLENPQPPEDPNDDRRMRLAVFQSRDQGVEWTPLEHPCAAATSKDGLWEPELTVAGGRLYCYFSYADENADFQHSQRIVRTTSGDGVTWSDPEDVVALQQPERRPGMPVVRRLPDGRSVMSYEICGSGGSHDCAAYLRVSPDGVDWGDETDPGTPIALGDGTFFAHAPKIAVIDDGTPDGLLVTVGQQLKNADGTTADGNGGTLLVSEHPGTAEFTGSTAPVHVPSADGESCGNYSSALVPLGEPSQILEIAADEDEGEQCHAYFATGPL
ncbi:exo-alpha-sialidase [Saccharopolyspora sp. NFXS83]|uniref:exo-alpha-sialidase n=1 Tax=Saccharopolyspora sp. NFXS83 TaxID=2993560 RepID=UPI00224B46C3|nr:exo-alpha-sialidase [Saccharopolyspora sp. NFXS83]MCX2730509.1 exo-alpha-sialidase [Saccharopolyspora sp. NFXS83]